MCDDFLACSQARTILWLPRLIFGRAFSRRNDDAFSADDFGARDDEYAHELALCRVAGFALFRHAFHTEKWAEDKNAHGT